MSPRSWVRFTPRSGTVRDCIWPLPNTIKKDRVKRTGGFRGGSFGAAPACTWPLHAPDLVPRRADWSRLTVA